MTPIIEICVVVLTVGLLVAMVVGMISLKRLGRVLENTDRSLVQLEGLLGEARRTLDEGRVLFGSIQATVERVDSIAADASHLSHRVAAISETLLTEVEAPVQRVAAISRGMRAAVNVLRERWIHRTSNGFAAR